MTLAPLTGIEVCVFDAYGTLFDVASAARRASGEFGERSAALAALWRDKQLQYTWLRAAQGRHADFWQVTGEALDFALAKLALAAPGRRARLMALYRTLEPYPEVPAVLARLKRAGMRMAILSNGTPEMLAEAVTAAGLDGCFDPVLSIEAVGVYKPHPAVYQLAVDALGVPAAAIAFQSANGWDAWAAAAFGLRVVWLNRGGEPPERLPGTPEVEMASLAGLPERLGIP